jgi:elongator complex protein 3
MIELSEEISKKEGFNKLAVISAIGTKGYYKKRGFKINPLYMIKSI